MSYQHPTRTDRTGVPSSPSRTALLAAIAFAGQGYVLTAPAYVGLGTSPGPHPYLHATTEAFIAGGARVYAAALRRAERIYLTRIGAAVEGDVRFPDFDWGLWRLSKYQEHPADGRHAHPFRFEIWDRERF